MYCEENAGRGGGWKWIYLWYRKRTIEQKMVETSMIRRDCDSMIFKSSKPLPHCIKCQTEMVRSLSANQKNKNYKDFRCILKYTMKYAVSMLFVYYYMFYSSESLNAVRFETKHGVACHWWNIRVLFTIQQSSIQKDLLLNGSLIEWMFYISCRITFKILCEYDCFEFIWICAYS